MTFSKLFDKTIRQEERLYRELFKGGELFLHFVEMEIVYGRLPYRVVRLNSDDTFTIGDPLEIARPIGFRDGKRVYCNGAL